ncbi:hypothetical protein MESS2_940004 [Mesorhizobium metallidurans STM 2683]|uniref:Uncharacterized protein n=1 Tax=Mesorhizobium metallidurans STM 2683 TaxID=1297569 RepID=M5EYV4_9HYPH|nr:hypothetical protein MESS2_940004 [Mesorhizobium metallidurans STM 2683]
MHLYGSNMSLHSRGKPFESITLQTAEFYAKSQHVTRTMWTARLRLRGAHLRMGLGHDVTWWNKSTSVLRLEVSSSLVMVGTFSFMPSKNTPKQKPRGSGCNDNSIRSGTSIRCRHRRRWNHGSGDGV